MKTEARFLWIYLPLVTFGRMKLQTLKVGKNRANSNPKFYDVIIAYTQTDFQELSL